MKYIDTNVLVRLITGDNQAQAEQAAAQIQNGARNEFGILDAVLVELCFVLEFHDYKMARQDIAEAALALASMPQIFVTEVTRRALANYKAHPGLDYADCLLLAAATGSGSKNNVLTFDKDLLKTLAVR